MREPVANGRGRIIMGIRLGRSQLRYCGGRSTRCAARVMPGHELHTRFPSQSSGAGDLSDARRRVRDWPDQDRVLQVRQRPGHAHRGRDHRTTRHQGRCHGQVGLLLAVPVCHRLQGRTAVLSRAQEECDVPGRAHGGPLRDQPGDDAGGGKADELRHRDRGRPDGRRVHRINGDRHRQRYHRSARAAPRPRRRG